MAEPVDYDSELQRHNRVLRQAYGIRPRDRVLDIGCGTGQTTRDAARMAVEGGAMGIDSSKEMIQRADELSRREGVRNVTFQRADAEHHPFPPEQYDVAISRFGTMFFAHPVVAFANIARALRPSARLVMMVWQEHPQNEWSVEIDRALSGGEARATDPWKRPGPFSLADPTEVRQILSEAGFTEVRFSEVNEPVYYGRDSSAALEFVSRFESTSDTLGRLDPGAAERALDRLRHTLAAHESGNGVWFDSRAWIVTAQIERSAAPPPG